jgi:hypothetical protein
MGVDRCDNGARCGDKSRAADYGSGNRRCASVDRLRVNRN